MAIRLTADIRRQPSADIALVEARENLLASLTRYRDPGPRNASTAYIWPTDLCLVGCGHCNFASPPSSRDPGRARITERLDGLLRMLEESRVWKVVLSGGGEPLLEQEFCRGLLAGAASPDLAELELITSGYVSADRPLTVDDVAALADAWRGGRSSHARFQIRISVDWFHRGRIGLQPAVDLISILTRPEFEDVGFYIRSVLLENDTTVEDLAAMLGGRVSPIEDYQQDLILPDGRTILVYYKNLILDGRITRRKLDRLPVALPAQSTIAQFGKRFEDGQGHSVPARTYNGPEVKALDGLACIFEDDGAIKILEGNAPDRVANLAALGSWREVMDHFYADPITVLLVREGPDALAALIGDRYPRAASVAEDHNELYHLVARMLEAPEQALYATLRALELHIREGLVSAPDEALARAWRALDEAGTADV